MLGSFITFLSMGGNEENAPGVFFPTWRPGLPCTGNPQRNRQPRDTRTLTRRQRSVTLCTNEASMGRHSENGETFTTREHVFTCPHCGERISMLLDLSAGSQHYVEDCEVCCNPVEITYRVEEGALSSFEARPA